ncbi:MAG: GrpB family protein [Actinomycetota bacterium]|nr:GrpB family protein [Actinomycetota bacterium]
MSEEETPGGSPGEALERHPSPGEALERHPSLDDRFDPAVRLVEYDAAWPAQADEELRRLKEALGPVAVRLEHVGSTAVPGLAAKPILDLQISVAAIEPRAHYVEPLERLGYLFVPAPESPDFHFFAKPPQRPRTHHLHICEVRSEHEFRHVAVRDFLRAHGDEAAAYAALKRQVVARHPQDRLAYIEGKQDYVAGLQARAVERARG